MTLKIYNTLTREKETFQPIISNKVSLYACGVTVYDYCHIGHARTYTFIDMIVRYLSHLGYEVNYVRNITDIDDKIIKRSQEKNVPFLRIVNQFIDAMYEDFDALNLLRPTHEPRATEYISKMLNLIETMIANNHAYVAKGGDVYFRVRSAKDYGILSHHDLEQLESGIRVEINDVKEDPLDFVVWKIAKPNEPSWPSSFGEGRPGWHTECTAMSLDLLGEEFDIHTGARDLIFPHHENEIAQAHAVSNKKFAKTWMHMGFLTIDQEKMSKSLGNFITIRDALKNYDAEVLRYLFITSHYRSPLMYNEDIMAQSKNALTRLYTALRFLEVKERTQESSYEKAFIDAMNDDFNTPIALSILFELAHEIQRSREKDLSEAQKLAGLLKYLANILGLLTKDPEVYFTGNAQNQDKEHIDQLIAERNLARSQKNWKRADEIRDELANLKVIIEDGPKGTTWRREG